MSLLILEQKAGLRKRLKGHARLFSPIDREEGSRRICEHIRAQWQWENARVVVLFSPMPEEPDIWPLAAEALAGRKTLGLPAYDAITGCYRVCQIRRPAEDLFPGRLGILEPGPACSPLAGNELDLILVPGLGFALDGRRLGRGKGYYDRLLADVTGCKCGVAFEWQITGEIPMVEHDVRLNCVVTPGGWHAVQ